MKKYTFFFVIRYCKVYYPLVKKYIMKIVGSGTQLFREKDDVLILKQLTIYFILINFESD